MIELLAPAGDLEKLKIAYMYGADACFIGGQEYSLRARASNFSIDQIKEGADFAHSLGKKLYVTTNIIIHHENEEGLVPYLKQLEGAGVDGIIVASPAIVLAAKKHTNLEVHISTQQSILNNYHVNYWEDKGATRVVLGRELSVEQIKDIVAKSPVEVEVFIHGGMCSSFSGRCTLSNTFTLRDANRGGCAHSCRWNYDIFDGTYQINEEIPFSMGSKDLQAINQIPALIDAGVDSLKIEGRMKSIHYIATVVSVYRMMIDEYNKTGKIEDFDYYNKEMEKAENRVTDSGFLEEKPTNLGHLYGNRDQRPSQLFVGLVLDQKNEYTLVQQRNNFKPGDKIEIFGPNKRPQTFVVDAIYDKDFNELDAARHPLEEVYIKVPFKTEPFDMLRVVNE